MLNRTKLFALSGIVAFMTTGSLFSMDTTQALNEQVQLLEAQDKADIARLSEAFGHFIGRNLKSPGMNFDLESIIKGMREGAAGNPAPMSDQEYDAMMLKAQEAAFLQVSTQNLKNAEEFIEKNKSVANIHELEPSKLQYEIISEGSGPVVVEHNSPQISYVGKFSDGTVFSSSEEAGGAITIPLDQTIPGFGKGLLGMKEGEKRRLFVHPDLGYGTGGQLPPNSLLIFDVEVIKANNSDQPIESDDEDDLFPLSESSDDSEDENKENTSTKIK